MRASTLQHELEQTQAELSSLRRAHDELVTANEALTTAHTNLQLEHRSLTTSHETLLMEVSSLRTLRGEVAAQSAARAEAEGALASLQHSLSRAQEEVSSQKSLVRVLTEQLKDTAGMRSEIERLTTAIENSRTRIATMEEEFQALRRADREHANNLNASLLREQDATREQKAQRDALAGEKALTEAENIRLAALLAAEQTARERAEDELRDLRGDESRSLRVEKEREEALRKVMELESRIAALDIELRLAKGASGKTAAELERLCDALRRDLVSSQAEIKRVGSALADAKYDREVVMTAYKKLQAKYLIVKEEIERLGGASNGTREELTSLRANAAGLQAEIDRLRARLETAVDPGEMTRLRQELAMLLSTIDKQNALIDQLRLRLGQSMAQTQTVPTMHVPVTHPPTQVQIQEPHSCAQGKRCPCKSRPPAPARWQS